MRKYKCPNCGNVSTSMYCDTCQKSIPSSCAVYESIFDRSATDEQPSESSNELSEITEYTKRNNYLLSQVERHTKIMSVIMVISVIVALASAVFTIIGFTQFSQLFFR